MRRRIGRTPKSGHRRCPTGKVRYRDAVGFDLDERNAALAMERVGMFLTVDHLERAA